jgi:ferritin-like metal-binding protein YciE
MKFFSSNVASLPDLYIAELAKALDLEETLTRVLPRMALKARDLQLRQVFRIHEFETQRHVMRVKRLLRDHASKTCKVMRALAAEADDAMFDVSAPETLDVALITAAQRMEHYEMAVYASLKGWARQLGRSNDYEVLSSIEVDEKKADRLLQDICDRITAETHAIAA